MERPNTDDGRVPSGDNVPGSAAGAILERYLAELKAIRSSGAGVAETSYYPALSELFNAVGKSLKPKVRCVMNLRNLGLECPTAGYSAPINFSAKPTGRPRPANSRRAERLKRRELSPTSKRLPRAVQARVENVATRLQRGPNVSGAKALRGNLAGHFRIRTGDYRVQFRVAGNEIMIERGGHRDGFYED